MLGYRFGLIYLQKWRSKARCAIYKMRSICSADLNTSKSEELNYFILGDMFWSKTFVLHMKNEEQIEDAIGKSSLGAP